MSTQIMPGDFPGNGVFLTDVLTDSIAGPPTQYSSGVTSVAPVSPGPLVNETWSVLGWTIQLRIGFGMQPTNPITNPAWGKLGDVWAGLALDSQITAGWGVNFPPDISSFLKIVDGGEDEIRQIDEFAVVDPTLATLVAETFMLQNPFIVRPGGRLVMGLLMTPTLFGADVGPVGNPLTLTYRVLTARYSIIYESKHE